MNNKYKEEIGSVSIIAVLVIIIVILIGILAVKILTSNEAYVETNTKFNSNNSKSDNMKEYSKIDIITLLEKGENYNNYSCEYVLDEVEGKTTQKFKDNVLVVENGSRKVYQNYTDNKHIVINKDKNIALVSNLNQGKLIPLNKNYCNGLVNLLKDDSNITYKYIKEEEYNEIECIVIEIESKEKNISSQFSFGEKNTDNFIKTNMTIWISKKSGLVAKIEGNYETNTNEKKSKIVDYNLVLNNVTSDDIKEPSLTSYRITNM